MEQNTPAGQGNCEWRVVPGRQVESGEVGELGDLSVLFPIENWLESRVIDVELLGPIAKARAEFAGWMEPKVRASWDELEAIVREWMSNSEIPTPTYQPRHHIVRAEDGTPTVKASPAPLHIDYLKAITLATRNNVPALSRYLRSLDPMRPVALTKVMALLVLREAAAGEPERAIRASWVHDLYLAKLRPLIDDGASLRRARRAGGRATTEHRARDVQALHAAVLAAAQAMLQSGRSRRELASTLVERFPELSLRSIRRILKRAEI